MLVVGALKCNWKDQQPQQWQHYACELGAGFHCLKAPTRRPDGVQAYGLDVVVPGMVVCWDPDARALAVVLNQSRPADVALYFSSPWAPKLMQQVHLGKYWVADQGAGAGEMTDGIWGVVAAQFTLDGALLALLVGTGHLSMVSRFGEPCVLISPHLSAPCRLLPWPIQLNKQSQFDTFAFSMTAVTSGDKRTALLLTDGHTVLHMSIKQQVAGANPLLPSIALYCPL